MSAKAAMATLGCKVNQYETAVMQEELAELGYELVDFSQPADLYIINTCAVTSRSEYQSRQLIHRAINANPQAFIVVTGCYAETGRDSLNQIPGVNLILGQSQKQRLKDYLEPSPPSIVPPFMGEVVPRLIGELQVEERIIDRFLDHSRAYIKIQDGCNAACSYCIVPLARGRSRSQPWETVCEQARRFIDAGYQELVLTGIHIGAYGFDLRPPLNLPQLLEKLISLPGLERLRLSSIEPAEVTPGLVDILTDPKICPHLHIPLQSGDNGILKAMRRPYTAEDYARLIETLCQRIPDLAVGADVMVGFPGENEDAFRHTLKLVQQMNLAYLHVFRYSPRPKTSATAMGQQVPGRMKLERSAILRAAGQKKWDEFRHRFIGQPRPTLVLQKTSEGTEYLEGLTDNYIKVLLEYHPDIINHILPVNITQIKPKYALGKQL